MSERESESLELNSAEISKMRNRFTVVGALVGAGVGVGLVLAAGGSLEVEMKALAVVLVGFSGILLGIGFANDPVGRWIIDRKYPVNKL